MIHISIVIIKNILERLLVSIKRTLLILLVPVYIFGLVNLIKEKRVKEILRFCMFIVVIPIIFSGFWYIRNWIVTGNPVYPAPLTIFGIRLFDGGFTDSYYHWFMKETSIMFSLMKGDLSFLKQFLFLEDYFGKQVWLLFFAAIVTPVCYLKKGAVNFYIAVLPFLSLLIYSTLHASAWGAQGMPFRYGYLFFPLACLNIAFLMNISKQFALILKVTDVISIYKSFKLIIHY